MSRFLIPDAIPSAQLRRAIPELRNPRYARIYDDGRERRIVAELAERVPGEVPRYSDNATYQSLFSKGWNSVTQQDVRLLKSMMVTVGGNCRCKVTPL